MGPPQAYWVRNSGGEAEQYLLTSPLVSSVCVQSHFVWLCLTLFNLWAYSLPSSSVHGILQAESWSGLPFPPPDPGIELASLRSPALAGRFFTSTARWVECTLKFESHLSKVESGGIFRDYFIIQTLCDEALSYCGGGGNGQTTDPEMSLRSSSRSYTCRRGHSL